MKAALRRTFLNSGQHESWTGWAAILAFLVIGAALRTLAPEAGASLMLGALTGGLLAGGVAYCLEFPSRSASH